MPDAIERLRTALVRRYAIEREIGRGGMAYVYLARDLQHQRPVAVKLLRPELAASLGNDRFLREIRIAAALTHPHIVPLYDSGEVDDLLYFIMPYIEGESLRERLRKTRPLPVDQAVHLARDVAAALEYAHRQGIIHRDIKPGNVLLNGTEALVADFGIARAITVAAEDELSETGLAMGTPAYMSPEQCGGTEVDARSDIYSLGCVLYEMLTGTPPFSGGTAQAILARHLCDRPKPMEREDDDVPRWLERVIERALQKLPADRFATAAEFGAALEATQSVSNRVALPQVSRWSRRSLAAGGLALTLLAGGAMYRLFGTGRSGGADLALLEAGDRALDPTHIAVLYFESRGADPSVRSTADGLTEDLIDQLGLVSGLSVISANGVRRFRTGAVPIDSIARSLGVGSIVTGTVSGSAADRRVTVRLLDAATGRQLQSKVLTPSVHGVTGLQDNLAEEVARFLREQLGQQVALQARRSETHNDRAWLLLRQAQAARDDARDLFQSGDTAASRRTLDTADSLLKVAAGLDPAWAEPLVIRGWIAADRTDLDVAAARVIRKWGPRAIALADSALRRQPDLPAALELRGYIHLMNWQFVTRGSPTERTAAERDLRAALVPDNSSPASAWDRLSFLLATSGSFAEANVAARRAYEADAFLASAPAIVQRLWLTSMLLRRWSEATSWCDQGARRFPEDWQFGFCQLMMLSMPSGAKPDAARAWRLVEQMKRTAPPSDRTMLAPRWQMIAAGVLARAGLTDSARHTAQAARVAAAGDPELDFYDAGVLVLLGERTLTLGALERYLRFNPGAKALLRGDPRFDPISADRRFVELVGETRPIVAPEE
ncbi:MAG: protein kinase [Gemmatimonadales bacterium]|nr:protein kinase [Gemmatimonadales bacterium]